MGPVMVARGFRAFIWLSLLSQNIWPLSVAATPSPEGCVACHLAIDDDRLAKPAQEFVKDIHAAKGFGCISCHGGDAQAEGMEAMDPDKGYLGKPERLQVVQVCGRCHADADFMKRFNPAMRVDQVAEYYSSVHGRRLKDLDDPKVPTCVSCHPAHAIKPPSDPSSSVHPLRVAATCARCHADAAYMQAYGIPTDQWRKYQESVHWMTMSVKGDLAAPTCNDCHGNHGATPPGISWVGNVCGQCHMVQAEFFAKSPHAQMFAQLGAPGCVTCHDNHQVREAGAEMLGVGETAVCAACHTAQDTGGEVAAGMRALVDGLHRDYEEASTVLRQAERAGMEVSQARFELTGANDALIKAGAAVHTFTLAAVKQEAEVGLAISAKAEARGLQALAELQFRRKGLALSVLIILALIVGLVLKIRQLERRQ
jgi:predicted CXXCH cytochrome family protein